MSSFARILAVAALLMWGCARCGQPRIVPPTEWTPLEEGLRYTAFKHAGVQFHVLRVDLNRYALRAADARQPSREVAEVSILARESHAIAAVNGTFFDDQRKPLGWLVSEGKQLNPLHDTSWWAALVVRQEADQPVAEVLTTEALKLMPPVLRASVRFAVQVGPRTVVDGKPLKLKNQKAERTAACVTTPQEVLLLVTHGALTSNDLAEIMARPEAEGGLGCRNGLMFDGGPSTQMTIATPKLKLDIPGGWGVPDAVVVVPRADAAPPAR